MIRGAVLLYVCTRAQKQSFGPAILTITGKAISGETRLLAVTAFNSITRGMQCEKVVLTFSSTLHDSRDECILVKKKNIEHHNAHRHKQQTTDNTDSMCMNATGADNADMH